MTMRPHTRAASARERFNNLPNNEIVFVDRLGPRILRVPNQPPPSLSRETLRELGCGRLSGQLGRGTRFLASRMLKCPEITVDTNGQYTVQKHRSVDGTEPPRFTIKTLNVWTGTSGELLPDRNIDDLIFYSVSEDLLPAYHSRKGDRLERREGSEELEKQNELSQLQKRLAQPSMTMSDLIDQSREKYYADIDEKASNDAENMLRLKPNIVPSDPAWEGVEEYFKWILEEEREKNQEVPRILKIINDEFTYPQQLLAIPAVNSGWRAKIQDENTEKYYKALKTTFHGKPDNLVTKLTMLCFGLPIMPLTLANVNFAGGPKDIPAKDGEDGPPEEIVERIEWSEKPLEFLDSYNKRSYGYPMIRTPKRKFSEIDETTARLLAEAKGRSKRPVRNICGFNPRVYTAHRLHLRGGAGNPSELTPRKFVLYTDMGQFFMEDHYGAFWNLAFRLLRLEGRSFCCQLDLIPVRGTDAGLRLDKTRNSSQFRWTSSNKAESASNYIKFTEPKRQAGDKWILRLCYIAPEREKIAIGPHKDAILYPKPVMNPTDPFEPDLRNPHLVYLEVKDIGIAYWYLPKNRSENIIGVNQYQDTFRNAMECLLPDHRGYTVKWTLSKEPHLAGELHLIAEAPSMELWEATKEALKSKGRVTINFEVIPNAKDTVKILMPGRNSVALYRKISGAGSMNERLRVFKVIKDFVQRAGLDQTAVRIWSGPGNYSRTDQRLSRILPPKRDNNVETDVWMSEGLIWTEDSVVVRPELTEFRIIDVTNSIAMGTPNPDARSVTWGPPQSTMSLTGFRECLLKLFINFDPSRECVAIEQPSTNYTFIITPDMTELQWRFQVFDWLHQSDVRVRRNHGYRLVYSKNPINGPLGTTSTDITVPTLIDMDKPDDSDQRQGLHREIGNVETTQLGHEKENAQEVISLSAPDKEAGTTIAAGSGEYNAQLKGQEPDASHLETSLEETQSAWKRYQEKQFEQEQLRVEAYTESHSVFRRGSNPEIPLYGPPSEKSLLAGPRFPTLYTNTLTATDAAEMQTALRKCSNVVLDRQDFCPICKIALDAGPHNQEVRERHFQEHRDALKENRGKTTSNFSAVVRSYAPEAFYCEFCGKSQHQWEKDNKTEGAIHGPSCSSKAQFNSIPQFCQYCGLNFWTEGLTPETTKTHLQNCADLRTVSPQGQISLYQQLLSRLVDRGQPTGESRCHFSGCSLTFNSATTNIARARHLWDHINGDDVERVLCGFPGCSEDLAGFADKEVIEHFKEHVGRSVDILPPSSRICPFNNCYFTISNLTWDQITIHLKSHDTAMTDSSKARKKHSQDKKVGRPKASPRQDEDQNNIPDRLKDANKGKNFYCPSCLMLVSGQKKAPCRSHRGGNCNILGHDNWLILTAQEIKMRRNQNKKGIETAQNEPADKKTALKIPISNQAGPVTRQSSRRIAAIAKETEIKTNLKSSKTQRLAMVVNSTPGGGKKRKDRGDDVTRGQAKPSKRAK